MARSGIFNIGNEEEALDQMAVAAEPIIPEEVVEEQQDHEEFQAIAEETAGDINDMTEAEEATETIEEQVAENEEKLEKPEEVTAVDAAVAQESLRYSIKMLGGDPEVVLGRKVSRENMIDNPVDSLRVSNEGAKEVLLKIIEQIKFAFKKIVQSMKKLYAQAVVVLSRSEKTAIKLKDAISKRKEAPADASFSEKEIASIASRLGVVIVARGGTLGNNPASELKDYAGSLTDTNYFKAMTSAVTKAANVVETAVKDPAATPDTNKEIVEAVIVGSADSFCKKVQGMLGSKFNPTKDLSMEEVYAVKGNKAYIVAMAGTGEAAKTVCSVVTLKQDAMKEIKVAVPTPSNLVALIDEVIKAAKGSKPYADAILKEIDANDKAIVAIGEVVTKVGGEVSATAKLAATKFTSAARILSSNVGLNSILAQVDGVKALLAYATMAAKKLPAA